ELPELSFPTVPLSKSEVEYPELWKIHQASSLQTPEEVAAWRARAKSSADKSVPSDAVVGFSPRSTDTIEQVILRRGSSRRFAPKPITLEQLRTILEVSTGPVWPGFTLFNDLYLIVNAVDGLAPGAYYFHTGTREFELLRPGNFRTEARYLGLRQDLPGDAAADVFFLADLHPILA